MIFDLSDLKRRLENIVRIGTIANADYETARVRVRIGSLVTGWIPWLTSRAGFDSAWWAPELGEQVLVFSPSGELASGVCLPAIYQNASAPKANTKDKARVDFENGAYVEHNKSSGVLRVFVPAGAKVEVFSGGDISLAATGKLTLSGSEIEMIGPINHSGGDISSDSNIETSEEVTASGIPLSTHKHGGVQSGGSLTDEPE